MFEITVKKIEGEKIEENVFSCEECIVIGIDPMESGKGVRSEVYFCTSIDNAAKAIASETHVRASARVGIAYHESVEEATYEEGRRRGTQFARAIAKIMDEEEDEGE